MKQGQTVTIGELETIGAITAIQHGNHGDLHPKSNEYTGAGVPFIMARDIRDGVLKLSDCKRLPKDRTDRLRIGFSRTGDVLLTHKGTVRQVAIVPAVQPYIMLTPQVTYYQVDEEKISRICFAAAFRSAGFQQQLASQSAQSTRPYIGIQAQRRLQFPIYPLSTQHRIASILSTYDDLIENNTRRIAIIEEMARRHYDEWLVHFRFPGHEDAKMDSEMPSGWESAPLNSLGRLKSGYAFKSKTFEEDGVHCLVTIKNVQDGEFLPDCDSKLNDLPGNVPDHCHLKTGDLLLSLSGNVGRVCIVFGGEFLLNQRVTKVVPNEATLRPYLYFLLRSAVFRRGLENIASGVAQQNLSPVRTEELAVPRPTNELLSKFNELATPVIQLCTTLRNTNRNPRAQRDLLLPKLVSGEIDVSEINLPNEVNEAV